MKNIKSNKKIIFIIIFIIVIVLIMIAVFFGVKKNKRSSDELYSNNESNVIDEPYYNDEIGLEIKEAEQMINKINQEIVELRSKIYGFNEGASDEELAEHQEENEKIIKQVQEKEEEINKYYEQYAELNQKKGESEEDK